jgi:hypothetical protein
VKPEGELLLLLLQHYNPGWVLAFSTSLFDSFLFLVNTTTTTTTDDDDNNNNNVKKK